jgi:hypothetical protein
MPSEPTAGSRLDVHLPDGGHLSVTVEVDGDRSADAQVAVATAVVLSGDVESDIEAAVEEVGAEFGLSVERSAADGTKRTRRIVVRSP